MCVHCGKPHHDESWVKVPDMTGRDDPDFDPAIRDSFAHVVIDVFQLLREEVGEAKAVEILTMKNGPLYSLAFVARGMYEKGQRHGIEDFWLDLIAKHGEGRYVVDVGPRGVAKVVH